MERLALRLKQLRKNLNKSQQDISNDLGIPQTTYAGYELSKTTPRAEMLLVFAEYFKVSTDYLLGATDIKYTQTELEFFNEIKDKGIDQLIREYNLTLGDEAMSEKDERILIKLIKSFMDEQ